MNKIILIGGAPGVGKSTLAKKIAETLHINWISTDQIRTIMQKATNANAYPELFVDVNKSQNPIEALQLETKKSEAVWSGALEFIENNYPWEGCVIEGTAILPNLVARDLSIEANILTVFIVQSQEAITKTIEQRSKYAWINTKTTEQKRNKVAQTIAFNDFINRSATQYGFKAYQLNGYTKAYDEIFNECTKFYL